MKNGKFGINDLVKLPPKLVKMVVHWMLFIRNDRDDRQVAGDSYGAAARQNQKGDERTHRSTGTVESTGCVNHEDSGDPTFIDSRCL